MSIADKREVEDAARPGRARRRAQFGGDRLDPHRVLADSERPQFLDRALQAAGQRAAEIGRADADRAVIGLDFEGDDRPFAVRVFRRAGERLVGRESDDIGADAGDFHRADLRRDQVL